MSDETTAVVQCGGVVGRGVTHEWYTGEPIRSRTLAVEDGEHMAQSLIFLLGCWLGCMVGFVVAGLTSAGRSEQHQDERASHGFDRLPTATLTSVLADDAIHSVAG